MIDDAFGIGSSTTGRVRREYEDDEACKPKLYVLYGMGGIGKMETAIEYLCSRREQFDVVIWIFLDTARKFGAQFVTLAQELVQGAASGGLDEVSARDVVQAWLVAPVGERTVHGRNERVTATWLMVFDNADNPDILYDWLPTLGPGCILVTGRYPYMRENSYRVGEGLELEPFSSEDGGKMVRMLPGREEEVKMVDTSVRISKLLGGLPIAIAQMSAIFRRKHLTSGDFEEWFRENPKDLLDLQVGGMQTRYQHTVSTTWAVEQLTAPAFALLNVLSILDPDRMPEELLMDDVKDIEYSDYPAKKTVYFNARAELIYSSFVARNMGTNELRIHRIIQEVVRQKMGENELGFFLGAAMSLVSAVWPYVCGTDPTRNHSWRIPIAEKCTPHICSLEVLAGAGLREEKFLGTATSGYVLCSYAW